MYLSVFPVPQVLWVAALLPLIRSMLDFSAVHQAAKRIADTDTPRRDPDKHTSAIPQCRLPSKCQRSRNHRKQRTAASRNLSTLLRHAKTQALTVLVVGYVVVLALRCNGVLVRTAGEKKRRLSWGKQLLLCKVEVVVHLLIQCLQLIQRRQKNKPTGNQLAWPRIAILQLAIWDGGGSRGTSAQLSFPHSYYRLWYEQMSTAFNCSLNVRLTTDPAEFIRVKTFPEFMS